MILAGQFSDWWAYKEEAYDAIPYNGALLREVAERAGYDLHFTPFQHRAATKTSVLYTTRRE